jgi:hypothetical protein
MLRLSIVAVLFATTWQVPSAAPPALPKVDYKACPFECCQFGEWKAEQDVRVYDRWQRKGRKELFTLHEGESVTAITGVHVTYRPGRLKILRDIPDLKLRQGDTVETYMYTGEGYVYFWSNGRMQHDQIFTSLSCSEVGENIACLLDHGDKEWWVKLRTKSGRVGWVRGNEGFSGSDACG